MNDHILDSILAWDQAGPVAILVLVLVGLAWITRWLLKQLISGKDASIKREQFLTDKMTDEIGVTLDAILNALRERKDTT